MLLTIVAEPLQAHAVGTKVASKVAVKMAKEVIVDSAVQEAMDIIFHKQMEDWLSGKYDNDSDYVPVCYDDVKPKKGETCKKPVQVKKTLTTSDKKAIETKAEQVLDTKMGNKGWIKFLDWVVPIIGVGIGLKWLESVLDPDTESLFDQVAMESLIGTGIIKPVKPVQTETIVDSEYNPIQPPSDIPSQTITEGIIKVPNFIASQEIIFNSTQLTRSTIEMPVQPAMLNGMNYILINRDVSTIDTTYKTNDLTVTLVFDGVSSNFQLISRADALGVYAISPNGATRLRGNEYGTGIRVYKNGSRVYGTSTSKIQAGADIPELAGTNLNNLSQIKVYPITVTQTPDRGTIAKTDYFERVIDLKIGSDNLRIVVNVQSDGNVNALNLIRIEENHSKNIATQLSMKLHVFNNASLVKNEEYVPELEDFPLGQLQKSKYNNGGTIKILAPDMIPISTPDGVPVKPSKDSPTGWTNIGTGEDIEVDEEELIVGDPIRTPDGIKAPGGEEVIPEVPEKEKPEKEEEDYPACEKDLDKIEFNKVGTAFTHAFPFSIPWDMKRMIDKAFGGIGDEKPSVELSFLGDGIVLEMPDLIDKWMPFARGLLILLFDIAILMFFYRLMKGDM